MSLEMKYFVLKPKAKNKNDHYALASQVAMDAYAESIQDIDPELARELKAWSIRELLAQEHLKDELS